MVYALISLDTLLKLIGLMFQLHVHVVGYHLGDSEGWHLPSLGSILPQQCVTQSRGHGSLGVLLYCV